MKNSGQLNNFIVLSHTTEGHALKTNKQNPHHHNPNVNPCNEIKMHLKKNEI